MTWSVKFLVPSPAVAVFEEAVADLAMAVSSFESGRRDEWQIEVLLTSGDQVSELEVSIAEAAAGLGLAPPGVDHDRLPDADWVAETMSRFTPFRIGRFYVHQSHHRNRVPPGSWPLQIDAATAFGTGEHESTAGCLRAIDGLARHPNMIGVLKKSGAWPVLDFGCGTGILAFAMARAWPVKALAADMDEEAVRVARREAVANGLKSRVNVVEAESPKRQLVVRHAPFGLITANILARPLCGLARDLSRVLVSGGRLVLSGILSSQVQMVLAAYAMQGLRLERRLILNGWATLVLRR